MIIITVNKVNMGDNVHDATEFLVSSDIKINSTLSDALFVHSRCSLMLCPFHMKLSLISSQISPSPCWVKLYVKDCR